MRLYSLLFLLVTAFAFLHAETTSASPAIKSTTIAEYVVTQKSVGLQLEIGVDDLKAFADILPKKLRSKMGIKPEKQSRRVKRFLQNELYVMADGKKLKGKLIEVKASQRTIRDEVSGKPLEIQPENAPVVLYVNIRYPFKGKPETITISAPKRAANIGFRLYHTGQNVNDFSYLSGREKLHIDWNDPFYTVFENESIVRHYSDPIEMFLYLEPFEVRGEFVVRPADLQQWIDLGLEGKDVISMEDQKMIKEKAASFLLEHSTLKIDGKVVVPTLDRIYFVKRTAKRFEVITPSEELAKTTAFLGVIYSYKVSSPPKNVDFSTDLFNKKIKRIRMTVTDQENVSYYYLDLENSKMSWINDLAYPQSTRLLTVETPQYSVFSIPLEMIFFIFLSAFIALFKAVSLIAAMFTYPFTQLSVANPFDTRSMITNEKAVTHALLSNIYHAFEFKDDGRRYGTLSYSLEGDLRDQVYEMIKSSLKLKSQKGAEAKVYAVDIRKVKLIPLKKTNGYRADIVWDVNASASHWGESYGYSNRYHAEFDLVDVQGKWKFTAMRLLSEEKIR